MITCITLDKNGIELYRETKPKRFRPVNGFQKISNGDFVKRLSDPRCISDQEKAKAIIEARNQAEEKARKEAQEQFLKDNPPAIPIQPTTRSYLSTKEEPDTKFLKKSTLHSLEAWKEIMRYSRFSYENTICNKFIYHQVTLKRIIGLQEIDVVNAFEKIELHEESLDVKMWIINNRSISPDFIIMKGIYEAPESIPWE